MATNNQKQTKTDGLVIPSGWKIIDSANDCTGSVEINSADVLLTGSSEMTIAFHWTDIPALILALELAYEQLSKEYGDT